MLCPWIIYGQWKKARRRQKSEPVLLFESWRCAHNVLNMKSIAEPGDTLLLVPPFCVNSPFNMRTLLPEKKSRPEVVPQIWEYSRKHYARPLAEVEAEIQEAWIGKKEKEAKKESQQQ